MRCAVLLTIVTVALSACKSDPMASGPTAKDLQSRLAPELPAFIKLRDLSIAASSNVGDRVDPVFKTRFSASIELLSDTYQQAAIEDGAVIVVPLLSKGTSREVFGVAQSTWYAGAWKTAFAYEGDPVPALGRPRDMFGAGIVLVRGSDEETRFRADVRKRQVDDEARRVEASRQEAERIRAESERETERLRAAADAEAARRKAEEQIKTEQRRQAEEEGERRLRVWLSTNSPLNGKYYGGRTDIRITFSFVDPGQRVLRGMVDWDDASVGSLPATYPFEGRWVGDTLNASGTKTRKGDGYQSADIRKCNLTLTAKGPDRLEGTLCDEPIRFAR